MIGFLGECSFLFSKLTLPATRIFFGFFISASIIATTGNVLSLIVLLQPRMRNKSNNMLVSLVLSDALVGCVLTPYSAYELIETDLLHDCKYEFGRIILTVSFTGTSTINIAIIAFERYVALATLEPHQYHTRERKRTTVLIILSWILPGGLYAALQFSYYLRNILIFLLIIVPLVLLTVFYGLIAKSINRKSENSSTDTSGAYNLDDLQRREDERLRKLQHARHEKLTKTVTYLIVCYIVCLIPGSVSTILNIVYVVEDMDKPPSLQGFFLFSALGTSINSCINPIIYAAKFPEFQKTLIGLWNKLKHKITTIQTSLQ